jgi:formylglycine-generating enzyme required for sulfatase activity
MMRALAILCAFTATAAARPAKIGPGTYRPIFPASPAETSVAVPAFELDRTPVTNAEYLAFVEQHPQWRKDRIKPLLADDSYLAHWTSADDLGSALPQGPVVRVSWFAARAFCAARGGRLPLEREWELAAAASETSRDASRDPKFQERIVAWYTQLAPAVLPEVGGKPNKWGARDMHGLVWEWIEDFSAALVDGDSRTPDRKVFCGGSGATSRDPTAYATFMRIALRSSLEARSTTAALGFRCAYDLKGSR